MTVRIHVRVDGQYVPWESLSIQKQKEIAVELNERAMKAAGYIRNKTA
jgi:hypothetical protein